MVKARKYVVKKHFEGLPKRDDFEIVEQELPPLKDGEFLFKAEWISVDPYHRAYNPRYPVPYDQFAFQVGTVEDSKDPEYPVGTRVIAHRGWSDYCIIGPGHENPNSPDNGVHKLPDLNGLSPSLCLGAVGMPGATAYFGLLELCKPKAGETLVVTGAAGAVGSLVGQIGKIKGCKVIGFAGDDEKVKWLKEIGFDKAINYKTADIAAELKEAAPEGVDMYFDNVGGEISSLIIHQMREFGRVAVCGSISAYNEAPYKMPKATILQLDLIFKQLKMEGFLITRWLERSHEAYEEIIKWINSGEIKVREHITEGFDKIYDAFVGMLNGENIGKAVVKM
ncbi:prostaglandin reductase 1-like [Anticarsia gemmatalis]|uniref:prostaglandin reductase 1-like n=1 Tax=Anticarsia gemmatalis TaxID=129554 RepID=UPI003F775287